MDGAKQIMWHQAYERQLKTISSLRNHCDFTYERDSKNAKEVRIVNAVRPTSKKYTGVDITLEDGSVTSQTLLLDQADYVNVGIDDVVKAQSVPGALDTIAKEGAEALADGANKYVASLIKAAKTSEDIAATTAVKFTKTNVIDVLEDGFEVLYSNNVPVSEELYLEVSPKAYKFIRPAMIEASTSNPELIKKGIVGMYGNALVTIENLLPTDTITPSGGSAQNHIYNVLRTKKAIAFAEQIDKVETYRPEKRFSDAVKALYSYGAKIVRTDEIVVIDQIV